ncbi:MAG: hypothetical protein EOO06_04300 [Chitinophagaceae bacterium]|nr:MAG: hypothetical protein EOO06_04300 [Chitinophagaceae bacterium]
MKQPLALSFLFLAFCPAADAQYYYKDIVSSNQLQKEMSRLKENKIRTINIRSFEDDGTPSEGFFAQKKISKDFGKTELLTRSNISAPSLLISNFNNAGQVLSTHDSSEISVTTNAYQYTPDGKISRINSSIRSRDDDFTSEIHEEHIYNYNENGQPEKMVRVKNFRDSTVILFATDEHGNVAIEKDTRTGSKYYYYYDAKNRLTDVVQENDLKLRMHPDYIFEYNNSAGNMSQMTTTEEGGSYYYVWKYTYDNGLRVREKCYNKERKLMGTIEYEYK